MLVAYIDESGDDGPNGSQSYVLGCVVVESAKWSTTFDELVTFRRYVRDQFEIPMRAEIKANFLIRNSGELRRRSLSEASRHRLYRAHLRMLKKVGLGAFAIVIDKPTAVAKYENRRATSDIAWEYLLQRLERSSRSDALDTEVLILHDEGDATTIRARARKARRAGTAGSQFGTGQIRAPFRTLLDDPVPRQSHESYFLQLADLAAYAAFRKVYPPPSRSRQICPVTMWDELGSARWNRVTNQRDDGIVLGP